MSMASSGYHGYQPEFDDQRAFGDDGRPLPDDNRFFMVGPKPVGGPGVEKVVAWWKDGTWVCGKGIPSHRDLLDVLSESGYADEADAESDGWAKVGVWGERASMGGMREDVLLATRGWLTPGTVRRLVGELFDEGLVLPAWSVTVVSTGDEDRRPRYGEGVLDCI